MTSYLARYRLEIERLFELLHMGAVPDDGELVSVMERRWLGGEHGPGSGKAVFDVEQTERAWPILRAMDLVDRVNPSRPRYDEIVVMGAAGIGLHRRLELVRLSGVHASGLSILAGLRPHSGHSGVNPHSGLARDGAIDELMASDGRFASAPGWEPPANLVYLSQILASTGADPIMSAQVLLPSETDLARLLLGKQWPQAALLGVTVGTDAGEANELGPRRILVEEWALQAASVPIARIFNGAPVSRGPGRPARPTSLSTVREWAATTDLTHVRSVLIVVNQPHLTRVRTQIERELASAGLGDLQVDVAGCEALRESADINLLLGEIPIRINDDFS